jgi:peptidoglycan hydrolase CwlO-like protein
MKSLLKSLKKIDISKDIFSGYKKEIETLKENIQNRELILEKYSRIIDELKGV